MTTQIEVEDRKKAFILEFMKLGMDFYGSAIAAECHPELIARLEADETFQAQAELAVKLQEKELLDRLANAARKTALRGDTRATERLLEILNPERYSKTTKLAHQLSANGNKKTPQSVNITFVEATGEFNG